MAKFTTQHYIAVAGTLQRSRDVGEDETPDYIAGWVEGIDRVTYELAHIFAADNELFDRSAFLAAAGINV